MTSRTSCSPPLVSASPKSPPRKSTPSSPRFRPRHRSFSAFLVPPPPFSSSSVTAGPLTGPLTAPLTGLPPGPLSSVSAPQTGFDALRGFHLGPRWSAPHSPSRTLTSPEDASASSTEPLPRNVSKPRRARTPAAEFFSSASNSTLYAGGANVGALQEAIARPEAEAAVLNFPRKDDKGRRVGRLATRIKRQLRKTATPSETSSGEDTDAFESYEGDTTEATVSGSEQPRGEGLSVSLRSYSPNRLDNFLSIPASDPRRSPLFLRKGKQDHSVVKAAKDGEIIDVALQTDAEESRGSQPKTKAKQQTKSTFEPTFVFVELSKQFTFLSLVAFRVTRDRVLYRTLDGGQELLASWEDSSLMQQIAEPDSPEEGNLSKSLASGILKDTDSSFLEYELADRVLVINVAGIFGRERARPNEVGTAIHGDTFQLLTCKGLHVYQARCAAEKRAFLNRIRFAAELHKNIVDIYGVEDRRPPAFPSVRGDIADLIDQVSAACDLHEEAIRRLKRVVRERVAQVDGLLQKLREIGQEHMEYLESFRFMHHRNSQDIQDGIDSLRKDSKASTGRLAVVQRRVEEMKETVDAGRYRLDVLKQALDSAQKAAWHLTLLSSRNVTFAAVAVVLLAILYGCLS